MAKISETLGSLKDRQSRLTSQRDAANLSLEKAKAFRHQNFLQGDVNDTKTAAALQAKVSLAESELAGLDDAVKAQAERVAEAERQLTDEATQAARKAASEALARDVEAIEKMLAPWLTSTRQLAAALAKYETFRFEAGSIGKYLQNASNELEVALSVTIPDLRGGSVAVLEGREAPPSQPAQIAKFVAPKPPPTKTAFFLRASKWTDDKGKLHLIQKFNDATLPLALAAHAIKVGAAVEMTDPVRKKNLGVWNGRPLHAEHCFALDAASETHEAVLHSAFTPVDRGPAYNIIAPVQRAPMAAARNMPPGKK